MGQQQFNAMELSAWNTGAGVAIGTNVDIGGVIMGSAATTVTIVNAATTIFSISGGSIVFGTTIAANGVVTGTSSGGSFAVLFRKRIS
jgi:hypothetical protein